MRKFVIILSVLFMIGLTACSANLTEKPSIEDGFTCEVDIVCGEQNYTSELHRIGQGVWEANLIEPGAIRGMSMHYENGEVVVRYKGFNVSLPNSSVPMKAVVALIFDALDNISNNPDAVAKIADAGNIVVEGENGDTKYIITFDGNGKLLSVNIPSKKLSATVKISQ